MAHAMIAHERRDEVAAAEAVVCGEVRLQQTAGQRTRLHHHRDLTGDLKHYQAKRR